MDAQQFLAEFRHIANAQGGIAHLRTMIYQLAVTGSLTPAGNTAEDAGQLLANISEKRQKLIHAKQYKRMLELESEPVLPPQSIALPATWRWTRLLDIGEINPRNDAPDKQLAAFVPMSGVPQYHRAGIVAETKRWGDIKKGYTHFANDDVVLAKITPCFENGKSAVVEGLPGDAGIGAGTTELHVFRPIHTGILPAYVYLFLRSPLFTVEGEQNMTGTAGQRRLPTDYFATRAFPLPPSEEQGRIVAKVDELMALCDQLEQQQQDRRKLQSVLRQSTLQALTSSQGSRELQRSWRRLQDNLGRLFTDPVDVSDLRTSILDLAVSGRLTFGIESDRSAFSLKDEILSANRPEMTIGALARKRYVKAEELKETALPPHWASIALDDAISTIDAGWSPACLPNARDNESKWGVLKTTSVQTLMFLPHEHKELPASIDPRPQYQINVGDILITRAGPKNRVGICCVVDVAPPRLMISDKLIRFHIIDDLIDPNFVALSLSAGEPGRVVERLKSGMAESQMNISQDKLRSITIPLPPIEEQRRVLEKVDFLMRMTDVLESQLSASLDVSSKAAFAAVAALSGFAIQQYEDTTVKAPKIQLIAPVRLGKTPSAKTEAPLARELARHNGEMSANDLWQRFGGEIDAFYAQLKHEVAQGWIQEPKQADARVVEA